MCLYYLSTILRTLDTIDNALRAHKPVTEYSDFLDSLKTAVVPTKRQWFLPDSSVVWDLSHLLMLQRG